MKIIKRIVYGALGTRSKEMNVKRRKFVPPTLKQAEDYVREKDLSVDPEWFINFYEAGDWHDSNGKPVKNWKQKMWTLHRMQQNWGNPHRCRHYHCSKQGVYPDGHDRDGHQLYSCIDHKPKPKPVAKELRLFVDCLKTAPEPKKENVHQKAKELIQKLGVKND